MDAKRQLQWRFRLVRRRIVRALCSLLYRDAHPDMQRSIMVAGTARSGTTWVTDLIASQIPCRVMFEPFHPTLVSAYQSFSYFQYVRPGEQNGELLAYCRRIFSGDIRHKWIDREVEQIFPKYRVVKDIRANLLLGWLHRNFAEVPLLFVIRHPCAVVLSRMQLGWWTDKDIEPYLSQPRLVEDFLGDKMDVIRRAKTVEEKHAVVWCVSNLVPITQLRSNQPNVVFYENLCTAPEQEIPRIFQAIGHDYGDAVFASSQRPSMTAIGTSAIVTGADKVRRWRSELSTAQIGNILCIVEEFGLGHIYGGSVAPLVASPWDD